MVKYNILIAKMKIKGKNNQEYILHSFIGQGQFGKVYSCPPNTK